MTRLVLDASAGVELLLNTSRARSMSAKFPEAAEWWVPEHYFVEVAGALRRAALSGDATSDRVDRAFSMLDRAVLRRAQVRPLLANAWTRRTTITVADALYVVLAEHIGATLVTADDRLARSPGLTISTIVP
ncbi:MAG: type II toxin-antitoxin system VapC family toxin [Cytophagales bacterium]|nr:type II toxin-antitoxin system VapC family toxin [Cytophagales bacterium]